PGVGAMYNGQYIKAIVHVLVFVVLIGISEHYGLFGIFLAAWVIYQVFDAHQTAKARRDGLPLPDPFGLNELGNAIGGHGGARPYTPPPPGPVPGSGPGVPPAAAGAVPGSGPGNPGQPYPDWADQVKQQAQAFGQQAGQWGEQLRQRIVAEASQQRPGYPGGPTPGGPGPGGPVNWSVPPAYGPPAGSPYTPPPAGMGWTPVPPVPPMAPQMELERARREPIGAIVLILLGMLFLFNTLGFFSFHWVSHGWPLIIVAVAIWLIARNSMGRMGPKPWPGPPAGIPPAPPVTPVEPPTAPAGTAEEPRAGGGQ
ncbi:MAG: hypothetical protein WBD46_02535, partial [Acidobacteriaceae bacterium]